MPIIIKPGITQRLNRIFVAFGFFLLLSLSIPAYIIGRGVLEEHSISRLHAISLQKKLTLDGWLSFTQSMVEGIANTPNLQDDLAHIYDAKPGSSASTQAVDWLIRDMQIWTQSQEIFAAFTVIDQDSGVIIASTLRSEIGTNVSNEPFFQNGKTGVAIQNPYYSIQLQEPVIRISLPFYPSARSEKAVLAVRIRLSRVTQIINRGLSQNDTNDVYLINSANQIVVPPFQLPGASVLQDTLHSQAIDLCLRGQSGGMATQNYQGAAVLTSYTWVPERGLCLLVDEDQPHAFADIRRFTSFFAVATAGILLVALVLAGRLSRAVAQPIFHLLDHVNQLGTNRLDRPVEVRSTDEFGQLAQAFNTMAGNVSRSMSECKSVAQENLRLYQVAQERGDLLQEERNFTNKLLDTVSSLVIVIDKRGRIIGHNHVVESMTGFTYDEIHDQPYTSLLHTPCGSFHDVPTLEDFLARQFPTQFDERFVTHQGEVKHIAWTSDALRNTAGEIEYIIKIGMDVTDRKLVEAKLRDSERNFRLALATAPISIYTTDQDLRITFMYDPHPGFQQSDVLGKHISEILGPEHAKPVVAIQHLVLDTGAAHRGQVSTVVEGVPTCYVYYADPITDASGAVVGLACAGYDITDLKKTEQALLEAKHNLENRVAERTRELRQSHKTLETMLNAIPESAMLLDIDGKILAGNQTLADRLNSRIDDLLGRNVYDFFPADLAVSRKAYADEALAKKQSIRYLDVRAGRYFETIVYPVLNEDGGVSSLATISIEITKWKLAEEAIQAGRQRLKELTRKVVVAQEEERHRVSRELHDEAGQALTALSISLKLFHADMPDSLLAEKKRLSDSITLVDTTMEQIRVLARDLRPQALDALGLNETLEGFCREFSRRTKIEITYQGVEVSSLPDITGVSFYRFLQEALTNVARHSEAKHVFVSLALAGKLLSLSVQDDGIGFVLDSRSSKRESQATSGVGLLGMRERIEMLGGTMLVDTLPGQGTRVVANINITGEYIERRSGNDTSRNRG
jgi:PAS domain S-box-containing protein